MTDNTQTESKFAVFWKKNGIITITALVMIVVVILSYTNNSVTTEAVLASALRHATPLVLGALCGLIGERSGIINIGIEGQMLMAAFLSFLTSSYTGSIAAGVFVGLLTGGLLGLLLAFMSVRLKVDQIIGGTVINILALGITGYFYQAGLTTGGKLQPIAIPLLSDIPIIGRVLFDNPPITYFTIILVFVVHYVLFHTKWGLRTRAVGEHPRAADTVGVNVFKIRYINTVIAGAIGGLAGAFLTLEAVGSFERAMTNGRGFVALAVMIFGKWTPLGSWGAALLFGLATAMQTQLQFAGTIDIPHQFIGMIPYLLTILVLAGFVGRSRPPAAEGIPYEKEG
ncbi:MAG: ABC transporter permease [Anaerolineales bacterium]|nr:ABC transporter permease [Anaerolineales bacterium]